MFVSGYDFSHTGLLRYSGLKSSLGTPDRKADLWRRWPGPPARRPAWARQASVAPRTPDPSLTRMALPQSNSDASPYAARLCPRLLQIRIPRALARRGVPDQFAAD